MKKKKLNKKPAKRRGKKANAKKAPPLRKANIKKIKTKKKPLKKAAAKPAPKMVKETPPKKIIEMLLKEMEQEAKTTRKILERVPEDKYDWKPHDKSMTLRRLATHVAELPSWAAMAINTDELNFARNSYVPTVVNSNAELMALLEKSLTKGRESLEKANDDILSGAWVMRDGDTIISKSSKGEVIRMAYCQIVHHRAQLGVYLRLLDIPIPGSYGPSADETGF